LLTAKADEQLANQVTQSMRSTSSTMSAVNTVNAVTKVNAVQKPRVRRQQPGLQP
jgi:hypothetical protein